MGLCFLLGVTSDDFQQELHSLDSSSTKMRPCADEMIIVDHERIV